MCFLSFVNLISNLTEYRKSLLTILNLSFKNLKDANFVKKYATAKMDLEKFINGKNNFYLWRGKDENSENMEVDET